MTAGRAEYLWKDDGDYKKPTRLSAPEYIELLLNWVAEAINDPAVFPVEEGAKFPRNFMAEVRNIYKRLFRLYAHLYCHHAEKIKSIGANAHLNTTFKHFSQYLHALATRRRWSLRGSSAAASSLPAHVGLCGCVVAVYFVLQFNLMDKVDLAPLDRLISRMREVDTVQRANGLRPPMR